MTALVSVYTPEGFVMGADGLRMDANGADVTDAAQKIFPIAHPNLIGHHAWAGTTSLLFLGKPQFNFSEESQDLMKELSNTPVTSLSDYVSRLGAALYQRLLASAGPVIPNIRTATENVVVRGVFAGYVDGGAGRVQILFPHQNGVLSPPRLTEVSEAGALSGFCIVSGSKLIWNEMKSRGISEPTSLVEAAHLIYSYIHLCADKRHEYPDCKNIGGHIHIVASTSEKTWWMESPRDHST
jgi:hypothetical protein